MDKPPSHPPLSDAEINALLDGQLREAERAVGRAKPLVRTHLLHELGASEMLIESTFGRDPGAALEAAHAAGADGVIVTVRTERDAEDALQLLAKLR